ncbi:MAG: terminase large subunit [Ardenticatenales bacterium]
MLFRWQRRFLQSLYGWRRPDGGRRFQKALLHVPKKNGKTLLVSILAAYELLAAVVASPLVLSASTTKENAKQVFEQLVAVIGKNPKLAQATHPVESKKTITVPSRDGEYRALSSDAPNAEGANATAVIVDEAHAHRSPKLYRALEYAMIGRTDGLIVIISTAGDDLAHWYYSLVERGRRVVAGEDLDPTFYAEVYEADPEKDQLDDPAVWKRVNPSLEEYPGFTTERIRLDYEAAKKNTADLLSFERYRLNIFRRAEDKPWIDLVVWDRHVKIYTDADLLPHPVWLGFDGSATTDPSSLGAVWGLPGKMFHLRSWAWVAEEGVRFREKTNLPRYRQFEAEGSMAITPGNLIDKALIRNHILAMRDAGFKIQSIVMDANGAHVFGAELEGDGFTVFTQPQSFAYFSAPTKGFQEDLVAGKVSHDGRTWLRWCVNSVRLGFDAMGNCRPVRVKSVDHIDGAIAMLMPYRLAAAALAIPPAKVSVYESRGIQF